MELLENWVPHCTEQKKALHSGQFILIKTKLQCSFFVITKRFYTACHEQGE